MTSEALNPKPNDETLETAAKRTFVVAIRTRPGMKNGVSQVVVVQAHSIAKAKQAAANKMKTGRFKYSSINTWVFDSCEEVTNDPTPGEQNGAELESGDSQGA